MPYFDQLQIGDVSGDIHDTGARSDIGDKTELTTTDKTDLVGAINEVNAAASDLKSHVSATEIVVQSDSQPIIQISDGSANKAKSYDVQIVPQQAGSGDPSPENVRTITGFTGAGVKHWGKNIADAATSTRANVYRATTRPIEGNNGLYLSGANGSQDIQSNNVSSWASSATAFDFVAPEDVKVTLTGYVINYTANCNGYVRLAYIDQNGTITNVGGNVQFNAIGRTDVKLESLTIPKGCRLVIKAAPASLASAITLTQYAEFRDIQVEISPVATAYEPPASASYSIGWSSTAGTVYGGSLHVNEDGSGTLTVTQGYIASYAGETLPGAWISDRDTYSQGTSPSTGAQVVYELAAPQTYTLTAPQIVLLYGTNNIWSETGDMAVEYIADTKLYIQTLTGHPDEDMIADANITSGSFFMIGNTLYLATANIANGSTVIPGTNCTQMSLAAALNSINA